MSWDKSLQQAKPREHLVQLYEADEYLLTQNAGDYIRDGLHRGNGLLVIASQKRRREFARRLQAEGIDVKAAVGEGRLVALDSHETLDRIMVGGRLDWGRFDDAIGAVVRQVAGQLDRTGLRAYGEMVGILWKAGRYSAAIRLERFWNRLLASHDFNLFCAYPIDVFGNEFRIAALDALLCSHTHVLPTGKNGNIEDAINLSMDEVLGYRAHDLRLLIKANYRPAWASLPRAEAIVLWLRNNLPENAEAILSRARQYYRRSQPPANP